MVQITPLPPQLKVGDYMKGYTPKIVKTTNTNVECLNLKQDKFIELGVKKKCECPQCKSKK